MDKQLQRFINKEARVVDTPCTVGVEPSGGMEYVTIKFNELNSDTPMYGFWHRPNIKASPPLKNDEGQLIRKKPKHTGNKFTYAKVYISEIKKYPKDKLSYEYAGMCLHLATFIDWEGGYLIVGYGKKKRYMERQDIAKALCVSESTVRRFMAKLEELKLLVHDKAGYKMIGKLFAKGREINAD